MGSFSGKEQDMLRSSSLLNEVSDADYQTFVEISDKASYNTGDILLKEGEKSDYLFIILWGEVELYKNDEENGTQHLIGKLGNGQSIGEMRVIRSIPCTLTVKAAEKTVVSYTLISKLRSKEYRQCYESILDSLVLILNERLLSSNQSIAHQPNVKKEKSSSNLFSILLIATLALFIIELGVALYYLIN